MPRRRSLRRGRGSPLLARVVDRPRGTSHGVVLKAGGGSRVEHPSSLMDLVWRSAVHRDASLRLWSRRPRLAPVQEQFALFEEPRSLQLDKAVEVAKGGDHDLALAVVGEEVVSDGVGLAGGTVPITIK